MPLDWMDITDIAFNALLLLERDQLAWFPGWNFPRPAISTALAANPTVAWYLRHKCPEIAPWLDAQLAEAAKAGRTPDRLSPGEVRQSEVAVLGSLVDLLVYALDPGIYDGLRFTTWDSRELTDLVDFRGKVVIFGDAPQAELAELLRVTKPGGMVIFCPGGNDRDDPPHQYLVDNGFQWAPFEEPGSGRVRKYWMVKTG